MQRKVYPSDITREQFEKIKPILEAGRKKNKTTPSMLEEVLKKIGQRRTFEKWQELQNKLGYR